VKIIAPPFLMEVGLQPLKDHNLGQRKSRLAPVLEKIRSSEWADDSAIMIFGNAIGLSGTSFESQAVLDDDSTSKTTHQMIALQNMKAIGHARSPHAEVCADHIVVHQEMIAWDAIVAHQ